jgi:hypothetical protein
MVRGCRVAAPRFKKAALRSRRIRSVDKIQPSKDKKNMKNQNDAQDAQTVEKNLSEAISPAPPMSSNHAREGDVTSHSDNTATASDVTPETALNTNTVDPEPASNFTDEPTVGESVDIRISTSEVDLDSIAVDQDFAAMAAVKPDSSAPPIRKPGNQLWFSPHADQRLWRSFLTIKDESDKDVIYVIDRSLAADLDGEYITTLIVPCITNQGAVFFWPIKLPDSEGRVDSWNKSKLEHVVAGAGKWLRLRSNQFTGGYDKVEAKTALPTPVWPDDVLSLLKKAVTKVYVGSLDHPMVHRLLGKCS